MGTWLSANWWWMLPVTLLPVAVVASVQHHKRILNSAPEGQRSRADAIAKQLLSVVALFLFYTAFSSRWLLDMVPPLFMFASLHVSLSRTMKLPNWGRYVAYFALLVLYLIVIPGASDG
jgi:hypothetical protein